MVRNQSKYQREFCQRLKAVRERANYSQTDFAAKLGLPRDTYAKYETRSLLPHDLIGEVARLTGRHPFFILTGADDAKEPPPTIEPSVSEELVARAVEEVLTYVKEEKLALDPAEAAAGVLDLYRQYEERERIRRHRPAINLCGNVVEFPGRKERA